MSAGWIGTPDQRRHFLVGADRDPDGRFVVAGTIAVGFGALDVVVGADARYFVGGSPRPLALDLRETSYGLGVTVI